MFIEKISIESFGSLANVSYDLASGVNIFRGKNESGKSTLAAFIKFIFYGLCGKTPDASMTEKTRYTNWDHGISGGSLVINQNGIRYRIERRVTPAAKASGKESVKVIDLSSNTEVFKGKCPGEVFFGVGEEIFAQTAFSAQGSGSAVDSEKMNAAIDNMMFAGNESLNIKGALKKLDEARIYLLHKNRKGGKLYDMGLEMENLEDRIAKAREDEVFLSDRSNTLNENYRLLDANRKELKKIEDAVAHHESGEILGRFAELDAKEAALKAAIAREKSLSEQYVRDGFLPDEGYPMSLKTLHAELGIIEQEKASLALQKDAFAQTSLTSEQRTVLQRLEADGGKEKAVSSMQQKTQKRKAKHRFGVVALVAFLLCAILSAVLTVSNPLPITFLPYIAYGLTALFLVLFVVSFSSAPSVKELYRAYLSENEDEALRRIDDALRAEGMIREEDSRYRRIFDAIEAVANKEKAATDKAASLLAKWRLLYVDRASLLTGADEALAALRSMKEAHVAAEGAKVAYTAAKGALSSYSREAHEKRFAETAYVEIGDTDSIEMLERKHAFAKKKAEALASQIRQIELDIAARSATAENLAELEEALSELKAKYDDYAEKCKAYIMAYEAIRKSGEALRSRIAPALSESASTLMKASTQGRYADIGVDNAMMLSFRESDAAPSREVGFMSAGTKALTYISLRLSLIRLLFRDSMPPTVFDESFSWLDNTRLASMMALLKTYSKDAQVIVMTCCDREYEACPDKESVNLIELSH